MTVPLIPREVLFGNPERIGPRLSPDGERLAFLAPKDGVLNVWVGPGGAPLEDFGPVTDDRERGIRVCFWTEDNQYIVYLQDEGGDENWRVHAVDASTKEDHDLTPFDDVRAQIVDKSRHFPDTLLVALNRDNPELHDVYRLTLSTGDLDLAAKNPGNLSAGSRTRSSRFAPRWPPPQTAALICSLEMPKTQTGTNSSAGTRKTRFPAPPSALRKTARSCTSWTRATPTPRAWSCSSSKAAK